MCVVISSSGGSLFPDPRYLLSRSICLEKIYLLLPNLWSLYGPNDPGCSAGYAHGLITAVAPQIQQDGGPTVAVKLCDEAKSRYEPIYKDHCGKDSFGYTAWFHLITMSNHIPDPERSRQLAEREADPEEIRE